ncbi:helix-turn-helix domain-containing protein [Actinocorallia sp. API 0066]|uniref:helix-turn-helix domain-containing protein n=1 Tax=Actinocorallia sp. API 0066 TaxID=2896846 RepID=UPI001E4E5788|nr:helix-turn-helix transcriptional regulator [Actinocorallia sp. API 0066]MCD0449802.1 helix-turn-helix domain-containing protein [Actinocorallia sp. API 0066]
MAVHPSSSVQRARQELAARLREIRLDAGLTGRALSAAAGWHEAKTSRIEGAKQAVTDADIRVWCRVCGAQDQAPDLVAASRNVESMFVRWRRAHATGLRHAQQSRVPLYERTRLMRVYTSTVVPGLLQTPAYAGALMAAITAFQGTPDDVEDAVAARMARNRVLHEPGHRFALLVEESVLRHRIGDGETMAGQLGHLLSAVSLPAVSVGVIPHAAENRPVWPLETFTVFDDAQVSVELLSAQVTTTAPGEIELYVRAYEQLAAHAVYGPGARALITAAITALD